MNKETGEMIPLNEAENEVKVVTQRLALLHLAYAKTVVEEFGWSKGKILVLKAIKEYGIRVADRTKRGFQSLPKYGFWEQREGKPMLCELGKLVLEYGEEGIGSLYCLIDAAKTMAANAEKKLIHTKCLTIGDEYCEFATVSTTKKDRDAFFNENMDWSHVDPHLDQFYKKKCGKE
ncbi:MAG: hypothetical protein ACXACA_06470 [Candidatus Ranarchaeia archaeon]|jgi:hypothetical protein